MNETLNLQRRSILTATVAATGLAPLAAIATTPAKPTKKTVAIEQTYLKASAGNYAALIAYLKANWFVMDQRAVEQGFFNSYQLMTNECADANGESKSQDCKLTTDWHLVMVVSYPQALGYDDPATKAAFDAIRRAHKEVLIDGKNFKALGAIVLHQRYQVL